MLCLISANCTSRFKILTSIYRRLCKSPAFSNFIFSSTGIGKFAQMKFTKISGLSKFLIAKTVSGLIFSEASMNLLVKSLQVSINALNSSVSSWSFASGIGVTIPFKYGDVLVILSKCTLGPFDCIITVVFPPGISNTRRIFPITPTWYTSLKPGSSISPCI